MLPRAHRVRTAADHRAVARRGRRAGAGTLTVQLLRTPGAAPGAPSRAGTVVPKTVGVAARRNRVRRQLQHLLADRLPALPPGTDLVVRVAPSPSLPATSTALAADLDRALGAALAPRADRGRRP